MKLHIKMKLTVFLLFFLLINLSIGQDSLTFNQLLQEKIKNDPALKHALVSIKIIDMDNESVTFSFNDQMAMPAASTTKLFSTAFSLEVLGPEFSPQTKIFIDKMSKNGVVDGDLFILGDADISLGSRYFNADGEEESFLRKWADTLYTLGLREIKGNIIGDGSKYGYQGAPDGWTWSDLGNYYGSVPSGLPIYDNILRFYFSTGSKAGTKANLVKTFPEIKQLNFSNYITSANIRGDNSYIYGAPYSYEYHGTGALPRRRTSYMVKGALPDSELQFADAFKRILIEKGIKIKGEAKNQRVIVGNFDKSIYENKTLIYSHNGRTLKEIIWWTNRNSVNVYAETILFWGCKAKYDYVSTKFAANYAERYWNNKLNVNGLNLNDGSGLSRSNAIAADHLVQLLLYMEKSKYAAIFKNTLSIAGEAGTLKDFCYGKAAHGRFIGKSGTLNKVKAYAGYLIATNGKRFAIAMIANNYTCTNKSMQEKFEEIINLLAK